MMTITTASESDTLTYPVRFNKEQNNRNQIPQQQNLELFIRHIPGVSACLCVVLSVFSDERSWQTEVTCHSTSP